MSSEEKKGFKIVDRRRFTPEGEERDGAPEEKPEPVKAEAPAPEQAAAASEPASPQPEEAEGALTFSVFVQSLAQQAMMQLGLVPWPHTGERGLQLEQARDTIDVLALMDAKTKGNLNDQEKQLLSTVLYELRLTYLEVNKQLAAAAVAP